MPSNLLSLVALAACGSAVCAQPVVSNFDNVAEGSTVPDGISKEFLPPHPDSRFITPEGIMFFDIDAPWNDTVFATIPQYPSDGPAPEIGDPAFEFADGFVPDAVVYETGPLQNSGNFGWFFNEFLTRHPLVEDVSETALSVTGGDLFFDVFPQFSPPNILIFGTGYFPGPDNANASLVSEFSMTLGGDVLSDVSLDFVYVAEPQFTSVGQVTTTMLAISNGVVVAEDHYTHELHPQWDPNVKGGAFILAGDLSISGVRFDTVRVFNSHPGVSYPGVQAQTSAPVMIDNVMMVRACPADLNLDGVLDFFDVTEFLTLYATGGSDADLTGDGVVDFFDVSEFLARYSAGCP